ncbi:MAG: OmpA family protein [Kofleriaceae bacterium]|nr:OmpA family protein [Myxococcales bacterium]MCB9559469.1 OmpA family protein [Kofleriaceae bacterium]
MRPARAGSTSTVLLIALGALVASLALAGCPKKKPKTAACDSSADCTDGLVCVDKTCQQCGSDADCGDGMKCEAGACVAKPECVKDTDCADGKVCQAGKCQACSGDNECGPGGKCNAGACERAKACSVDEDCEDDEDCVDGFCQKPWAGGNDGTCSLDTVYFGFDEATIAESERDRLAANATCIGKNPGKSVYVEGHTDATGTDEYNIALSERRARSVADFLARLGVDPAILDVVGKGEAELSGMGDDKDRRVEFQFH